MGFYLQLQGIIVFSLLFAIICLWLIKGKGNRNRGKRAPEPSRAWPLIGHLHLLRAGKPQHQAFGAMADKYGPIFCFHIGLRKTSVVSSWEVAKECFTTMDKAFATQPRSLAGKLMGYDHAMFGFSPCRAYWRDVRKLASIVLDCEAWTSFIALRSGCRESSCPINSWGSNGCKVCWHRWDSNMWWMLCIVIAKVQYILLRIQHLTRHITILYHFIRPLLKSGVLTLVKIHDNKNPTYMLTKALIAENLELCLASVGQG